MKATETIIYEYDPVALILNIKRNGKPFGGFRGASAEVQFQRLLETGANINITDMTNSVKSARVRRLRAMWIKQGIDQYRDAILEPYDVSSTADLSIEQLDELITRFSAEQNKPASDLIRTLRSDVLSLLNKLGIYSDSDNWDNVNQFLMSPKIAGKMLYNLNEEELRVLRRKLHSMVDKKKKSETEINRLKLMN